jgi:hypothetical protein
VSAAYGTRRTIDGFVMRCVPTSDRRLERPTETLHCQATAGRRIMDYYYSLVEHPWSHISQKTHQVAAHETCNIHIWDFAYRSSVLVPLCCRLLLKRPGSLKSGKKRQHRMHFIRLKSFLLARSLKYSTRTKIIRLNTPCNGAKAETMSTEKNLQLVESPSS